MMENHFMEYDDLLSRINELKFKMIELRETMYSVSGIRYDDAPKGTTPPKDITYHLVELEEYEQELQALYEKKTQLRIRYESEIDMLSNIKHRGVLRMHYLLKLDVYKIADALNLSTSHVRRLRKEASDCFMEMIANNHK